MKKLTILFSLAVVFVLFSCQENSKKEEAKNAWKETTYGDASTAQPVEASNDKTSLVQPLRDKKFDQVVAEGVTLVDFWATWCRPCLMQAPIVEQLAEELGDKVDFYKMDVDQNPVIPQRFSIQNIPTLMIFKDGKMVERLTGLQDKASLNNAIQKHLGGV